MTNRPLFSFSIAGLYSDIEKTFTDFSLPIIYAISITSSLVNPAAGDGILTPGKKEDFTHDKSSEHIVGNS